MSLPNHVLLLIESVNASAYLQRLYENDLLPEKIIYVELTTPGYTETDEFLVQMRPFLDLIDQKSCFNMTCRVKTFLDEHQLQYSVITTPTLNDAAVIDFIGSLSQEYTIFTGGGILKSPILSIPGKRFLHIHPGILPDVRGSDGLFWSLLLQGKPSASIFFMKPGIDTGELILSKTFEPPVLRLPRYWQRSKKFDPVLIRAALLRTVDIYVRTELLLSALQAYRKDLKYQAVSQDHSKANTYYVMCPALVVYVIDSLREDKGFLSDLRWFFRF